MSSQPLANAVKVIPPKEGKIYFSAYPNFISSKEEIIIVNGEERTRSHDLVTDAKITNFSKIVPKKLAWSCFDNDWYDRNIHYPRKNILTLHAQGIVPIVRMLPRSYSNEYINETKYTLKSISDGKWDKRLIQWARDAKNTKDKEGNSIPIMIDFALEMNGDWFAWSRPANNPNDNTRPKRYKAAYKHIIDIFRGEGVKNVTWIFHPNFISEPDRQWNRAYAYYPGNDYIDWIGISLYTSLDPTSWEFFSEVFAESIVKQGLDKIKKPFAIFEFAATEKNDSTDPRAQSKSAWLDDAFKTILGQNSIQIKAINYWHENWHEDNYNGQNYTQYTRLKIDSSIASKNTFNKWINNDRFISNTKYSKKTTPAQGTITSVILYENGMDILGKFNQNMTFEVYVNADNLSTGDIWGNDYILSYADHTLISYSYINGEWVEKDTIIKTNQFFVDSESIYLEFRDNLLQSHYHYSITTFTQDWEEIDTTSGDYY